MSKLSPLSLSDALWERVEQQKGLITHHALFAHYVITPKISTNYAITPGKRPDYALRAVRSLRHYAKKIGQLRHYARKKARLRITPDYNPPQMK